MVMSLTSLVGLAQSATRILHQFGQLVRCKIARWVLASTGLACMVGHHAGWLFESLAQSSFGQ